jgi:hypothetical protein
VTKFYTVLGRAMAEWANLEYALALWFAKATISREENQILAYNIFYSARSFLGRYDMLKAATASPRLTADERKFIRKASKLASDYNKLRSKLAHRQTIFYPSETPPVAKLEEPLDPFEFNSTHLTVEQVDNARFHFEVLASTILYALTRLDGRGLSPEEAYRRVSLLPKEPHLDADTHLLEPFLKTPF